MDEQGQTVRWTKVIDKSDKQENILKIRHTNLITEERADWKIILKFALRHKHLTTKNLLNKYNIEIFLLKSVSSLTFFLIKEKQKTLVNFISEFVKALLYCLI